MGGEINHLPLCEKESMKAAVKEVGAGQEMAKAFETKRRPLEFSTSLCRTTMLLLRLASLAMQYIINVSAGRLTILSPARINRTNKQIDF